jgi:hypothetical protein
LKENRKLRIILSPFTGAVERTTAFALGWFCPRPAEDDDVRLAAGDGHLNGAEFGEVRGHAIEEGG